MTNKWQSRETISSDSPHNIDVSVIICTRDRASDLQLMLTHMARVNVPRGWRVELLLVDNGSTDSTRDIVKTANITRMDKRYVFAAQKGKGYAYNAGLAVAKGQALLFTDDDVHVPVNWVEDMCGPILAGSADAVQGGIRIAAHLERPWLREALRTWVAAVEHPSRPPEGLVGANMALGRRAVELVGPFDVRLGPGAAGFFDDTLAGWKLKRLGGKIVYLPQVAVEHHFAEDRLNLRDLMAIARRMAASRAIVDGILNPQSKPSTVWDLLRDLPGLGLRMLTQVVRQIAWREPDRGFLVRYYRLKLWQARREQANAISHSS